MKEQEITQTASPVKKILSVSAALCLNFMMVFGFVYYFSAKDDDENAPKYEERAILDSIDFVCVY